MPELPEVETVRRGIEPLILKARITHIELGAFGLRAPFPHDLRQRMIGKRISSVKRRAKYLLIALDESDICVIHLGMSGFIRFVLENEPLQKHDHFVIHMDTGQSLVLNDARRFGSVFLTDAETILTHPAFCRLGPEPLDDTLTPDLFYTRLSKTKKPLKTALLDQNIIAGLGNIYVCEALYYAELSPWMPGAEISYAQAERLLDALRGVLRQAIDAGGSSLRDHRQTDGTHGYFQNSHAVYGRENEPCPDCPNHASCEGVKRTMQGGRSTFYCPAKQRV